MKLHHLLSLFIALLLFNAGCKKDNPISMDNADTQAPTATILYPVNGSTIKSDTTYTIIANAQDNKSVAYLEFYIDSTKVGIDSSSPYQYLWNTIGKIGSHSLMVKAYDAVGNAGSSEVIVVQVSVTNLPYNPSPADSATGISFFPTLSWSCNISYSDTLTYDIYFDEGNENEYFFLIASNITVKQTAACVHGYGLASNTTCHWRVIARDNKGATTSGPIWSFTTQKTGNPPNSPSNPSPANSATGLLPNTQLGWDCSDPEEDDITYKVFLGTSNPPTTQVGTLWDNRTYICNNLTVATTYYWQIIAIDSHNNSTIGPIWSFTTAIKLSDFFPLKVGNSWTYSYYHYYENFATTKDIYNFCWDIISRSDSNGINTFIVQETQSTGIHTYYHPVYDSISVRWVTDTTIIPATVRYFNLLEDTNHIITRSGNSTFWPGSINRFYSDTSYLYYNSAGYFTIDYKLKDGVGITEWNYDMSHNWRLDIINVKLLSNSLAP